jgi:hypothetical protein
MVAATLADGTRTRLATAECSIDWFDEKRWTEVVISAKGAPLIGVDLLRSSKLTIDYRTNAVSVVR